MTTEQPEGRYEFVRGPARGDGRGHRSAEWHRQRDEALTRPCPLEIPYKHAEDGVWRCGADVGQLCVRFPNRTPLERAPAHPPRIYPTHAPTSSTSTSEET